MQDSKQLTFSTQNWGRLLEERTRKYASGLLDPEYPLPDVLCIQDIPFTGLQFLKRLPHIQFGVMTNHLVSGVRMPVGIAIASKYIIRDAAHSTCWGDGTFKDLQGMDANNARDLGSVSDRLVEATEDRLVICATIVKNSLEYNIANTHGMWVRDGVPNKVQRQYLQELRLAVRQQALRRRGIVLMGDLNFGRGGEIYKHFINPDEQFRDCIPATVETTLDPKHPVSKRGIKVVSDYVMTHPDGRGEDRFEIGNVRVQSGFSDHCFVYGTITTI